MTEIMPVPGNLHFTVLPPPRLRKGDFFKLRRICPIKRIPRRLGAALVRRLPDGRIAAMAAVCVRRPGGLEPPVQNQNLTGQTLLFGAEETVRLPFAAP